MVNFIICKNSAFLDFFQISDSHDKKAVLCMFTEICIYLNKGDCLKLLAEYQNAELCDTCLLSASIRRLQNSINQEKWIDLYNLILEFNWVGILELSKDFTTDNVCNIFILSSKLACCYSLRLVLSNFLLSDDLNG